MTVLGEARVNESDRAQMQAETSAPVASHGADMSAAGHLCRAASGGLKARGWGRVMNVAQAHGRVASL